MHFKLCAILSSVLNSLTILPSLGTISYLTNPCWGQ